MSQLDSSLVIVASPVSPGYDQVRVDVTKEVLSTRQPGIELPEGRVVTRLLLLVLDWSRHADVLGQEVNEHLQVWGKDVSVFHRERCPVNLAVCLNLASPCEPSLA